MKFFSTYFKRWPFFIVMFTFWLLFNFNLNLDTLIFGFFVSFFMTIFASQVLFDHEGYRFKRIRFLSLIYYFLSLTIEIFKAAFMYIQSILQGGYEVFVFDIHLHLLDPIGIALVANSITLTPGTVSVDLNGNIITVLAVAKKGTKVSSIKDSIHQQFEKLLQRENI